MGRTLDSGKSGAGGGAASASGTPKVLFNGTTDGGNLTSNDEIVLFTNDALTTTVVESILVDKNIVPTLKSGLSPILTFHSGGAEVAAYANASGSEVVAPSTSFTCKLGTPVIAGQAEYFPEGFRDSVVASASQVRFSTETKKLVVSGNNYEIMPEKDVINKYFDASYTESAVVKLSKNITSMNAPAYYIEVGDNAYYFYYDGNSTTQLLRSPLVGGYPGAWQSVNTSSYAYKAIDIDDLVIRWADNTTGTYREHDLLTNVTRNLGGYGASPSSYSASGTVNGIIFYIKDSGLTSTLYYHNTRTGASGQLACNPTLIVSSHMHVGATYNPDEDAYYLSIGYTNQTYTYKVAGNLSSMTNLSTSGSFYPNGWGTMHYTQGNANGEMFIANGSNKMEIVRLADNRATLVETVNINGVVSPSNYAGWFRQKLGAPSTSALSPDDSKTSIRCKIDGTEHKENA